MIIIIRMNMMRQYEYNVFITTIDMKTILLQNIINKYLIHYL